MLKADKIDSAHTQIRNIIESVLNETTLQTKFQSNTQLSAADNDLLVKRCRQSAIVRATYNELILDLALASGEQLRAFHLKNNTGSSGDIKYNKEYSDKVNEALYIAVTNIVSQAYDRVRTEFKD